MNLYDFRFLFIFVIVTSTSIVASEIGQEPLLVSLGSFCGPATAIKTSGLRKCAFPLDWVLSLDGAKVVELLEDGFRYFTDEKYLGYHPTSGILLHRYYHIEFSHEKNSHDIVTVEDKKEFQAKYQRRIARFKQLDNYPGRVYFIRSSWSLSQHSNYVFANRDNLEISIPSALRLCKALGKCFPNLDFELVIINAYTESVPRKEMKVADRLRIVSCSEAEIGIAYNELFTALNVFKPAH